MSDTVESVEALNLLPCTIVVVKVLPELSQEQLDEVRETVEPLFPDHQVIIATSDVELCAVSEPAEWVISRQFLERADPGGLRAVLLDLVDRGVSRFSVQS